MSEYRRYETPEIERAYQAAHRELETMPPPRSAFLPGIDLTHAVMSELLGPDVSWQTGRQAEEWTLTMACVDSDHQRGHGFDVVVDDSEYDFEYPGSALNRAARAYRSAAGWDYSTPEDGGIWLLMLAPMAFAGGNDSPWRYRGHLVGIVILYDRDKDGVYEAVGHAWTAKAWRRQGIARRLLEEASSRFQAATLEKPYTKDGAALAKSVQWPGAAAP